MSQNAVSESEQAILEAGLAGLGVDSTYWLVINGLVEAWSPHVRPLILRGYLGEQLIGVAAFLECDRAIKTFLPTLGRVLDRLPIKTFYWSRVDAAVDLMSGREVVAPDIDRNVFVAAATAYLRRQYLFGSIMESRNDPAAPGSIGLPAFDWAFCEIEAGGVDNRVAGRKSLRKKVNRFRNKGGTLEVVRGRPGPALGDAIVQCLQQTVDKASLTGPFQDGYESFVRWACAIDDPRVVHVVARLEGEVVGYHSFVLLGQRLACLSGGFDRRRPTTFHAYESVMLEAMRWAEAHEVRTVSFGAIGNANKASLIERREPVELRLAGRFEVMKPVLAMVTRMSGPARTMRELVDALGPKRSRTATSRRATGCGAAVASAGRA